MSWIKKIFKGRPEPKPVEVNKEVPIYTDPSEVEVLIRKIRKTFKDFAALEKECKDKNIVVSFKTILKYPQYPRHICFVANNSYSDFEYIMRPLSSYEMRLESIFKKTF